MADTVVFLPCCGTKNTVGDRLDDDFAFTQADLPSTLDNLNIGREHVENNHQAIDTNSTPTSALHLYDGRIYGPLREIKNDLFTAIDGGSLRLFILSAGYGIVDAREKIRDYDAMMNGNIAEHWCNVGLGKIIKELLLKVKPKRIFGYFTGSPEWNRNQAAYRHFFTQGLKSACNGGLNCVISGCFYGKGMPGLTGLGRCVLTHYEDRFCREFAEHVEEHGFQYKNTIIWFDRLCSA